MMPELFFFDLIAAGFIAPADGAEIRGSPFNRKSRESGKIHASCEASVMIVSARRR
jgi:hypothetical protein